MFTIEDGHALCENGTALMEPLARHQRLTSASRLTSPESGS